MTKTRSICVVVLLALAGCSMSNADMRAAEARCAEAGGTSIAYAHLYSMNRAAFVKCVGGKLDGVRYD